MGREPSDTHVVRRRHPAMGTLFEAVLAGDDPEHLEAVTAACFEELDRVEGLLSRFDPASELARLNRAAAARTVQTDRELFALLSRCRDAWQTTGGRFDVTAGSGPPSATMADVLLDAPSRTVAFRQPHLRLDLGGVGKGYALDCVRELLAAQRVDSALVHGGTSSILAVGAGPDGTGWSVGIRHPAEPDSELLQRTLRDCSVSSSAAFTQDAAASDVIDPQTGRPLAEQAACTVIASDGVTAEILSTALLAMGRNKAMAYIRECRFDNVQAGWIDVRDGKARWEWLTDQPPAP